MSILVSFIRAIGAALAFGSYVVPIKLAQRKAKAEFSPLLCQSFVALSIFSTSWFALLFEPYHMAYSWWGFLSGIMWTFVNLAGLKSIKLIGMACAIGVWSGTTVVISFLWGTLVFAEAVNQIVLAVLGVVLIILGIAGISISFLLQKNGIDNNSTTSTAQNTTKDLEEAASPSKKDLQGLSTKGILLSILVGIVNGSLLVPAHYTEQASRGVNYMISFGIGLLPFTVFYWIFYGQREVNFSDGAIETMRLIVISSFSSGVIVTLGFFLSILTVISPLGYTIGYPLTQTALLISGLYGVFLFHELESKRQIACFFLSTTILLVGAILLAIYG